MRQRSWHAEANVRRGGGVFILSTGKFTQKRWFRHAGLSDGIWQTDCAGQQSKPVLSLAEIQEGMSFRLSVHTVKSRFSRYRPCIATHSSPHAYQIETCPHKIKEIVALFLQHNPFPTNFCNAKSIILTILLFFFYKTLSNWWFDY